MHWFTIWSVAVLLLTCEIGSIHGAQIRRVNYLNILGSYCQTPDSGNSTTAEELKQDEDYRSAISEFTIYTPPASLFGLLQREHTTSSDILNVMNEDNYRQTVCDAFVPFESDVVSFVRNREKCLFGLGSGDFLFAIAYLRTFCANDFEETLEDILQTVGEECIDSLFRDIDSMQGLEAGDIEVCKNTAAQIHGGEKSLERFRQYLPALFKNCLFIRVRRSCGDAAEAQAERLSERFINAMKFENSV